MIKVLLLVLSVDLTILFHKQLNTTFIFAQDLQCLVYFFFGKFKLLVSCRLFVSTVLLNGSVVFCPSLALVPVPP